MRLAVINGNVLLLYATFEEFVRQMALEACKIKVRDSSSIEDLPRPLINKVVDRHADLLSRLAKSKVQGKVSFDAGDFLSLKGKLRAFLDFFTGDLTQDIFHEISKNQKNLRVSEFNALFNLSGRSGACNFLNGSTPLLNYFSGTQSTGAFNSVDTGLEYFVGLRNKVTHDLGATSTISGDEFVSIVEFTLAVGAALRDELV